MDLFESSFLWKFTPTSSLTAIQKKWLLNPGPLTSALRKVGALQLLVLNEHSAGASRTEAEQLQVPHRHPIWAREVIMCIDGMPCVTAKSVTPLNASHGVWQGVRRLSNRPLADILYHDISIKRTRFEFSRLNAQISVRRGRHVFPYQPNQLVSQSPLLLARRSVFWRQHAPLLVTECFLSNFWTRI